jgi:cytochrome c
VIAGKPVRARMLAAGVAIVLAAGVAEADDIGAALVEQARCYACHQMTETLLGPPYRAIALRHAARRDVMLEVLATKIVHGGGGNWGFVPMVPNEHVTLDEARTMVAWILAQADE